jgi:aflatoxin B1 aldehyde reductase
MYQARYFKDNYFNAIEVVRPVAEKHNLTLLEVALRWMIHHSQLNYQERDGVIIGCSSVEQLESNLKDFEKGPLPDDVIQALDVSLYQGNLTDRKPGRSSNRKCRITGMLPVI